MKLSISLLFAASSFAVRIRAHDRDGDGVGDKFAICHKDDNSTDYSLIHVGSATAYDALMSRPENRDGPPGAAIPGRNGCRFGDACEAICGAQANEDERSVDGLANVLNFHKGVGLEVVDVMVDGAQVGHKFSLPWNENREPVFVPDDHPYWTPGYQLPIILDFTFSSDGNVDFEQHQLFAECEGLHPAWSLDFLSEGETYVVSIGYTVKDSEGKTENAILEVTFVGANDAPVKCDDSGGVSLGGESCLEPGSATLRKNAIADDIVIFDMNDLLHVVAVNSDPSLVGREVRGSNGGLFTLYESGEVFFEQNGEFSGNTETSIDFTVSGHKVGATVDTSFEVCIESSGLPGGPLRG